MIHGSDAEIADTLLTVSSSAWGLDLEDVACAKLELRLAGKGFDLAVCAENLVFPRSARKTP